MDQQIIFGPDNRSTGSVERFPRELGLTCNSGPYRITAEIVKDGGPDEESKSCYIKRDWDKDHVTLMVP